MRPPLTPLTVALLSLGLTACGGASTLDGSHSTTSPSVTTTDSAPATTATSATPTSQPPKNDIDNDSDNNNDDYAYGHAASAADRRAVTALVERYFAAAAAGDGATACPLIYSLFAEEIPELYGEPPGPPALRGSTCAVVMSKLFKQRHRQMVADHATLEVTDVRVKGRRAHALLRFETGARDLLVHREGRVWKVDEMLDSPLG